MTLAQLKRDAQNGKLALEMTEWYGKTDMPERLKGVRNVVGANTVCIKLQNADGKISELRFESATLVDYQKETLTIYNAGIRDMTEEERQVYNESRRERQTYEERNPYSDSYWHMKSWFKNCKFPYLDGSSEFKQGKRLQYVQDGVRIIDRAIKGDAILKYNVIERA